MNRIASVTLPVVLLTACAAESPPALSTVESTLLQGMPADAIAAPGDYDGDGCTDIGAKGSNGVWYIDYCANGFGGAWDAAYFNYGDNSAIPVPADYDGDGLTDLAVKDSTGMWGVDYAANGFGVFDVQVFGYGGSDAIPVPADYDGDGKADLSVKDASGMWGVDWASDGFHGWNDMHPQYNYGGPSWTPVPGNYDGNGHCSVTTTQACSLTSQCPAGQKCFVKADLAIKTSTGDWFIDKSNNGLGAPCLGAGCTRPQWDIHITGYGNSLAVPVPADYDHDGYTDLAVKDDSGTWYVDRAGIDNSGNPCTTQPCVGGWNLVLPNHYGGSWATAVPGNYTPSDGHLDLDLAVKDNASGNWFIDNVSNGFSVWDAPSPIANTSRPPVQDLSAPYVSATTLYDAAGTAVTPSSGRYVLTIGIRYTVDLTIAPGNGLYQAVFVEVNPNLHVPSYLNLENPNPPTLSPMPAQTHRRFSVTCSQPGAGMLGFEMRDGETHVIFNRDYGIVVACNAPAGHPTGLHGVVTARGCSKATCGTGLNAICGVQASTDGHYIPGCRLQGAAVSVPGIGSVVTAADGSWSLPSATGGPLTVNVTCSSASCFSPSCAGVAGPRSSATAVNVAIPTGSGVEVDTPLEERFFAPSSPLSYTTYIDYSRGRTVLHTVAANLASTTVRALRDPNFKTLVAVANSTVAPVVMNGGYFDQHPGHPGNPVGYYYSGGSGLGCAGYSTLGTCSLSGAPCYVDSKDVYFIPDQAPFGPVPGQCPGGQTCSTNHPGEVLSIGSLPMLSIKGTTAGTQTASIVDTDGLFWSSPQFTVAGNPACPLYDRNHDGISDVDYAIQGADGPAIVRNGAPVLSYDPNEVAWARTAVGLGPSGNPVYLVVADGEGVNGGHGATWFQLGNFFAHSLGAGTAMKLDGGLSTEMVLRGSLFGGTRHVNTLTGEDHTWDVNPFADPPGIVESDACSGSVANYLSAGQ